MALKGHAFCSNQNLLWIQKECNAVLRNRMTRKPYHILSDLCYFLVSANHSRWNDDVKGKGKIGHPVAPFPPSPSLLICIPEPLFLTHHRGQYWSDVKQSALGCAEPWWTTILLDFLLVSVKCNSAGFRAGLCVLATLGRASLSYRRRWGVEQLGQAVMGLASMQGLRELPSHRPSLGSDLDMLSPMKERQGVTGLPPAGTQGITTRPSNSTRRYVPKRTEYRDSNEYLDTHAHSSLTHIAKRWKQPNCPSTDAWRNKMWSIHTVE